MKCDKCKWADWRRTKTGRLHPDKSGNCTYEIVVPELPAAYYWTHYRFQTIVPSGGLIERGFETDKACVYYEEGETK